MLVLNFLLHVIGSACATHLWVTSEPTRVLRDILGLGDRSLNDSNIYIRTIARLLSCHACVGFWVGLAFFSTGLQPDFFMGALISVLATLIEKITRPTLR